MFASSAFAQTRTWTAPTSGAFTDPNLWTPLGPPTATDDASISFPSNPVSFTVTVPAIASGVARTLTLDAPGALLAVDGSLTVDNFKFLHGDATGTIALRDNGTLTLGSPTPQGGGVRRTFSNLGSFNLAPATAADGTIVVDANTRLAVMGGTTASNSIFTFQTGNRSVENRGFIRFGGNTDGTFRPLQIYTRNLATPADATFVNHGTVEFAATYSNPTASTSIDLVNGGYVNDVDGILNFEANTNVNYLPSFQAPILNRGVTNIAANARLGGSFTMQSGTLNLAAGSGMSVRQFTYLGGSVNGVLDVRSNGTGVSLAFADVAQASGVYRINDVSDVILGKPTGSTTGGDIPFGATVLVHVQAATGTVSLSSGNRSFTNYGSLHLEAASTALSGEAELNLGASAANTLTNHGSIVATAGASTLLAQNHRRVLGNVVNAIDGTIAVGPTVEFTAGMPVSAAGASIDNSGSIDIAAGSTLRTAAFKQTAGSLHSAGTIVTSRLDLIGGDVTTLDAASLSSSAANPLVVTISPTFATPLTLSLAGSSKLDQLDGAATDPITLRAGVTITSSAATNSAGLSSGTRPLINDGTLILYNGLSSTLLTNHAAVNFTRNPATASPFPNIQTVHLVSFGLENAADGTLTVDSLNQVQMLSSATLSNHGAIHIGDTSWLWGVSILANEGTIDAGVGALLQVNQLQGRGKLTLATGSSLSLGTDIGPSSAGAVVVATGTLNLPKPTLSLTVDSLRSSGDLSVVGSAAEFLIRQDGTAYGASRVNSIVLKPVNASALVGTVDIADNLLVVTAPGQFDTTLAQRAAGLTGAGLKSALAQANPRLDLGIVRADQLGSGAFTFLGQSVEGDDTLVRTTLRGDSNIDARVDFADLVRISQHYNQSGQTWADGDSNYDGLVNFADLVALAQNYNTSLIGGAIVPTPPGLTGTFGPEFAADWALAQSLAPEPTSLLAIGAIGAMVSGRRRAN